MHTAPLFTSHQSVPTHRHADVHCKLLGSENLGKKRLAAGSDTDGHSRIETSFQSSAGTAAGFIEFPPLILSYCREEILVFQTPNQLLELHLKFFLLHLGNLFSSLHKSSLIYCAAQQLPPPWRLCFRGTQRARLDLDQLLTAPGCAH